MRRLGASFPDIDWRVGRADGRGPAVLLALDPRLAEGAFRIITEAGLWPVVRISGGRVSGVLYAIEELIKRGGPRPDKIELGSEPIEASPGLAYRTFWTWDHSTNWELSQVGLQEIGVFNPYAKPPPAASLPITRPPLSDFCSLNRIAAIVIFGFPPRQPRRHRGGAGALPLRQ